MNLQHFAAAHKVPLLAGGAGVAVILGLHARKARPAVVSGQALPLTSPWGGSGFDPNGVPNTVPPVPTSAPFDVRATRSAHAKAKAIDNMARYRFHPGPRRNPP